MAVAVANLPTIALQDLIIPSGSHVILQGISWEQFEAIALAFGDTSGRRLTYNNQALEIMVPLPEHEIFKRALEVAVQEIGDGLDVEFADLGSTTLWQELRKVGVEPDSCFYVQNEAIVRGRTDIDSSLQTDPPPDLVLEIDVTSKSLARFPIYAQLGVPEIWRYDDGDLNIYELVEGERYQQRDTSLAFPGVPVGELPGLIEQHRGQGRRATRKAVREWAMQFRQ